MSTLQHDSIVSEPGYPATDTEMGDGSNFKHGQPAYQSAIISSSTAGPKARGKGNKFGKDAFGSGFRIAGGDSPTTLSDADIPSTQSFSAIKTIKTTQEVCSSAAFYFFIIPTWRAILFRRTNIPKGNFFLFFYVEQGLKGCHKWTIIIHISFPFNFIRFHQARWTA